MANLAEGYPRESLLEYCAGASIGSPVVQKEVLPGCSKEDTLAWYRAISDELAGIERASSELGWVADRRPQARRDGVREPAPTHRLPTAQVASRTSRRADRPRSATPAAPQRPTAAAHPPVGRSIGSLSTVAQPQTTAASITTVEVSTQKPAHLAELHTVPLNLTRRGGQARAQPLQSKPSRNLRLGARPAAKVPPHNHDAVGPLRAQHGVASRLFVKASGYPAECELPRHAHVPERQGDVKYLGARRSRSGGRGGAHLRPASPLSSSHSSDSSTKRHEPGPASPSARSRHSESCGEAAGAAVEEAAETPPAPPEPPPRPRLTAMADLQMILPRGQWLLTPSSAAVVPERVAARGAPTKEDGPAAKEPGSCPADPVCRQLLPFSPQAASVAARPLLRGLLADILREGLLAATLEPVTETTALEKVETPVPAASPRAPIEAPVPTESSSEALTPAIAHIAPVEAPIGSPLQPPVAPPIAPSVVVVSDALVAPHLNALSQLQEQARVQAEAQQAQQEEKMASFARLLQQQSEDAQRRMLDTMERHAASLNSNAMDLQRLMLESLQQQIKSENAAFERQLTLVAEQSASSAVRAALADARSTAPSAPSTHASARVDVQIPSPPSAPVAPASVTDPASAALAAAVLECMKRAEERASHAAGLAALHVLPGAALLGLVRQPPGASLARPPKEEKAPPATADAGTQVTEELGRRGAEREAQVERFTQYLLHGNPKLPVGPQWVGLQADAARLHVAAATLLDARQAPDVHYDGTPSSSSTDQPPEDHKIVARGRKAQAHHKELSFGEVSQGPSFGEHLGDLSMGELSPLSSETPAPADHTSHLSLGEVISYELSHLPERLHADATHRGARSLGEISASGPGSPGSAGSESGEYRSPFVAEKSHFSSPVRPRVLRPSCASPGEAASGAASESAGECGARFAEYSNGEVNPDDLVLAREADDADE